MNALTVRQLMFLLAHEAMHYMLSHGLRRGHRDAKAWNIAADKVINDTLIDAKVGDFIDGGITLDGARDMAAETCTTRKTTAAVTVRAVSATTSVTPSMIAGSALDDATIQPT